MSTPAEKHQPREPWKPLQPIVLRNPLLYRLTENHLLVRSNAADILIDCAHGVYRRHLFGWPKKVRPSKLDGDVLIDMTGDFKAFVRRRWEIYEEFCQLGIFLEVSSLEYEIREVENDAYDRDDVSDWFAWINGHATPVGYSVHVIIQALQNMQPRIRRIAAIALGHLDRHRGHNCYTKSENSALDEAIQVLQEVSSRLNDKELVEVYLDCLERKQSIFGFLHP